MDASCRICGKIDKIDKEFQYVIVMLHETIDRCEPDGIYVDDLGRAGHSEFISMKRHENKPRLAVPSCHGRAMTWLHHQS